MKHKKFNDVYSYTYYIRNNITGQQYHGVRFANISKNRTPNEDFAIYYFTSGNLEQDFKLNIKNYHFKLKWTFDTIEEASEHEFKINSILMYKPNWENWSNGKIIIFNDEIRSKISKGNTGKVRTPEQIEVWRQGTNLRISSGLHYWLTEQHALESSIRMKENNPSSGGLSEEHKEKIRISTSIALQKYYETQPFTEEHKQNLSNSLKGNIPWNKGKKGVQIPSAETKEKQRLKRIGSKRSNSTKQKMSESSKRSGHLWKTTVCCVDCKREFVKSNWRKHMKGSHGIQV